MKNNIFKVLIECATNTIITTQNKVERKRIISFLTSEEVKKALIDLCNESLDSFSLYDFAFEIQKVFF